MSYSSEDSKPGTIATPANPPARHNPPIQAPKPDTRSPWRKKMDKDIAFGIEQTIFCFVTDFIDPFVGGRVQNMYDVWKDLDAKELTKGQRLKESWVGSRKENIEKNDIIEKAEKLRKGESIEEKGHGKSAFRHAMTGEVMGDLTAIFAFVGMRQLLPQPIEWTKNLFRKLGDKKLEKRAEKELQYWAFKEKVEPGSEQYRTKVEEWKEQNAEDMAKSTAMSFWSTVNNIGFQRLDGNKRPLKIIALSKGLGAAITWGTMVGMRFILPKTMERLDDELARRYITPTVNFITRNKQHAEHEIEEYLMGQGEEKEPKLASNIAYVKEATSERLLPLPSIAASQANV